MSKLLHQQDEDKYYDWTFLTRQDLITMKQMKESLKSNYTGRMCTNVNTNIIFQNYCNLYSYLVTNSCMYHILYSQRLGVGWLVYFNQQEEIFPNRSIFSTIIWFSRSYFGHLFYNMAYSIFQSVSEAIRKKHQHMRTNHLNGSC